MSKLNIATRVFAGMSLLLVTGCYSVETIPEHVPGEVGFKLVAKTSERVSIKEGEEGSFSFRILQSQDKNLEYEAEFLPEGATFDKKNLTIKWTPSDLDGDPDNVNEVGKLHRLEVAAYSEEDIVLESRAFIEVFVINVNEPPVGKLDTMEHEIEIDNSFKFDFEFEDPDWNESFPDFKVAGQIPRGATISVNENQQLLKGSVSWTPKEQDIGTHVLTLYGTDRYGALVEKRVKVSVRPQNRAPVITARQTIKVNAGEQLNIALTATDPDGDSVTWEILSGKPDGAEFDPENGDLRWSIPRDHGRDRIDINYRVTDSSPRGSKSADGKISLIVEAPRNRLPALTVDSPKVQILVGEEFERELSVIDPDGDATKVVCDPACPQEITISGKKIKFKPTAVVDYEVTLFPVEDSTGLRGESKKMQFQAARKANRAIVLTSVDPTSDSGKEIAKFVDDWTKGHVTDGTLWINRDDRMHNLPPFDAMEIRKSSMVVVVVPNRTAINLSRAMVRMIVDSLNANVPVIALGSRVAVDMFQSWESFRHGFSTREGPTFAAETTTDAIEVKGVGPLDGKYPTEPTLCREAGSFCNTLTVSPNSDLKVFAEWTAKDAAGATSKVPVGTVYEPNPGSKRIVFSMDPYFLADQNEKDRWKEVLSALLN